MSAPFSRANPQYLSPVSLVFHTIVTWDWSQKCQHKIVHTFSVAHTCWLLSHKNHTFSQAPHPPPPCTPLPAVLLYTHFSQALSQNLLVLHMLRNTTHNAAIQLLFHFINTLFNWLTIYLSFRRVRSFFSMIFLPGNYVNSTFFFCWWFWSTLVFLERLALNRPPIKGSTREAGSCPVLTVAPPIKKILKLFLHFKRRLDFRLSLVSKTNSGML